MMNDDWGRGLMGARLDVKIGRDFDGSVLCCDGFG